MKKIFIIGLFAVLGIQACKKDEKLVDGKRPEERNTESVEKYKKELLSSTNGWKGYLYTDAVGGGYNFYLDFKANDRVTMRADYDTDYSAESFESTYQVKQVMTPTLMFDTYSYLHLLTDPDPNKFGGLEGAGYGSDFEFEIREQKGDTLKLVGKKRNTPLTLIKASAADKAFYTSAAFSTMVGDLSNYLVTNPFLYFLDPKDNTKKVQVTANTDVSVRAITLNSLKEGVLSGAKVPLSFSTSGLLFRKALSFSGTDYQSLDFNPELQKLFVNTSAGSKIEVLKSSSAIIPLHELIGNSVNSLYIPGATPLAGAGEAFITAYNQVKTNAAAGFSSTISDFDFAFNTGAKTFTISFYLIQSGTVFQAFYTFDYTKTATGEFKFSGLTASGGAGPALLNMMKAAMLNKFISDTFKLDYYNDLPNKRLLGDLTSIQTPEFGVTGILQ